MAKKTPAEDQPAAGTAEQPDAAKRKPPRVRSPNYPAFDLGEAIQKTRQLFDKERHHPAPFAIVASHLGYTPTSGTYAKAVATLKKFGLIDESGTGDKRQFRVSETGQKIIMDLRSESPERDKLIKEAAMKPRLHALLWKKYGGSLPTNENVEHYLRVDLKFNDDATKAFLREFKETIRFAKIESGDIIDSTPLSDSDDDDEDTGKNGAPFSGDDGSVRENPPSKVKNRMNVQPNPDAFPLPILMDDGGFQVVDIPKMTAKAFEFFKTQLDTYRQAFVIEPKAEEPQDDK